ncbi:hypothetical protein NG798_16890 [Ancylothrix sp. C2]|uniref:hypothetical protein n=1 Tax=Ancylothrix sp. D3o TaxID=2953691 RepID=UPI0021BB42F8|nr:hypothetical protein [Ancylothrix sp. D3o]MCT7951481.1 hypothetical protein [Ancylothrix sp. D3o]
MSFHAILPEESTLPELFANVWKQGMMTASNRQSIKSALLTGSLSETELRIINRMLYAVRRGWLRVAD